MNTYASLLQHLSFFGPSVLRASAQMALLAAIFVPLEAFFSVRKARVFYPGWSVNLAWYFVNALTPILVLAPIAALLAQGVHAVLPWRITHLGESLPFWPRVAAAMVVGELGYYWGHRLCHQVPFLWRFHAVHHSAEHVNFLVNARAHPLDMVFGRLAMLLPLFALGLSSPAGSAASMPVWLLLFSLGWSFVIHANVRLRFGPLEELIASPAFHHWHHTRDDHTDRNFSTMLPFIDRLFGTFYLPRHWPAAYGTSTPMPASLAGQLLEPFAPAHKAAAPASFAAAPHPIHEGSD